MRINLISPVYDFFRNLLSHSENLNVMTIHETVLPLELQLIVLFLCPQSCCIFMDYSAQPAMPAAISISVRKMPPGRYHYNNPGYPGNMHFRERSSLYRGRNNLYQWMDQRYLRMVKQPGGTGTYTRTRVLTERQEA